MVPWLCSATGSWGKGPGQGEGEDPCRGKEHDWLPCQDPSPSAVCPAWPQWGQGWGVAARWGESRAEASLLLNPTAATKNSDTSAPKLLPGCTEGLAASHCDPWTWRSIPNQGRD